VCASTAVAVALVAGGSPVQVSTAGGDVHHPPGPAAPPVATTIATVAPAVQLTAQPVVHHSQRPENSPRHRAEAPAQAAPRSTTSGAATPATSSASRSSASSSTSSTSGARTAAASGSSGTGRHAAAPAATSDLDTARKAADTLVQHLHTVRTALP
jgi:hypothetical protein